MNSNGAVVARYTYNAWGEILSVTDDDGDAITATDSIAHINPLRYRGYYYDTETGFYYLQSRYYDPENCRFINADGYCSTGQGFTGANMYAYCNNCPVIFSDHTGHISKYASVALFDGGGYEGHWIHKSIKMEESEDKITIQAYLTISGPVPSYVVSSGIEYYWEGSYYIDGKTKTLDIVVIEGKSKYGHSIPVITSHQDNASNTVGNVDMSGVPIVYIYTRRDGTYYDPRWTSAHEFGHCLGVEDYYTHEGQPGYNSHHLGIMTKVGDHATAEEVSMVLRAF